MTNKCKRCLLLEAGEVKSFETVRDYLENLDNELKVDDFLYDKRLAYCRDCDELISGMCLKCGCYVEIRAALKGKSCPNIENVKW